MCGGRCLIPGTVFHSDTPFYEIKHFTKHKALLFTRDNLLLNIAKRARFYHVANFARFIENAVDS